MRSEASSLHNISGGMFYNEARGASVSYIMPGLDSLGKMLVLVGAIALLLGVVLILAPKIPFVGRLPGDILVRRGNLTIYFPLVTMIVASVGLTIVLNLVLRFFRS